MIVDEHLSPPPPGVRAAAFFDLDKTVIAKSSVLAFSRPFFRGGLLNRRAVLRSAYAQLVFSLGTVDAEQIERMRARFSAMTTGWDVAQVKEIVAETLHQLIDPLIYDEAATLIEAHQGAGRDVVIVSTSGLEVVEPIGAMLGADHVVATQLVIEDGRYTGEIDHYVYAEEKASEVRRLADLHGYDLANSYAYSDSVTDVPMLAAVGHPVAVNPDRALRREAVLRGWPVLVFTRPVRLRARLPGGTATTPTVAAAAATVAAGAATAGVVWLATRRRARRTVA